MIKINDQVVYYQNNWIKKEPDSRLVSTLAIPGTHDSAAYKIQNCFWNTFASFALQTQRWDIELQLRNGIRYFDIRIEYKVQPQTFYLVHEPSRLFQAGQMFTVFKSYLKNNSSQFLILQIQQEISSIQKRQFGNAFKQFVARFNLPIYQKIQNKPIPTVGELRGKIWLLQAAKCQMNQFQINTYQYTDSQSYGNYIIQNMWDSDEQVKKRYIYKLLKLQNSQQKMKINFCNVQNHNPFKSIQSKARDINLYLTYVLMNDKDRNIFLKTLNKKQQNKCKEISSEQLSQLSSNLGILIMDFPSIQLIEAILVRNSLNNK